MPTNFKRSPKQHIPQNKCAHGALVAPRSRGPDEGLQAHE